MITRTSWLLIGFLCALGPIEFAQGRRSGGSATSAPVTDISATRPDVVSSVMSVDFGSVGTGESDAMLITLSNQGSMGGSIVGVDLLLGGAGNSQDWSVELDGQVYAGTSTDVIFDLATPLVMPGLSSRPLTISYTPTLEQFDSIVLRVRGDFDGIMAEDVYMPTKGQDWINISVSGLGGHSGDPFLHVVADSLGSLVDYDGDSMVTLDLDGSTSHTHEPGRTISAYEWSYAGNVIGNSASLGFSVPLGPSSVFLKITDDGSPARSYSDSIDLVTLSVAAVPGALALYYQANPGGAAALLDAIPSSPDYGEVLPQLQLNSMLGSVGNSPLQSDVMVRLIANVVLDTGGTYDFTALGGSSSRLELDGVPFAGPLVLSAGSYALEARFALGSATADLPVSIGASLNAGASFLVAAAETSHAEAGLAPIINSMPVLGNDAGGNLISIDGIGFFPDSGVIVHWGGIEYTEQDLSVLTPTRLEFLSPPGSGNISVSVETPVGNSKSWTYGYSPSGPVPIDFVESLTSSVPMPTAGTWGPDDALYVTSLDGHVTRFVFDATYDTVLSSTEFVGVSLLSNPDTLGIAINPHDPPSPVRLYVSHSKHFGIGGSGFSATSPYSGQVTILDGPNFDTPIPLITQLPSSDFDHGINGLQFDHNGDLLIAVGGLTNAGVKHPVTGSLPESPFSAAILKAELSKPGFNGAVTYVESLTGLPNQDQAQGDRVDVAPGVDLSVQVAGVRNPYGLVYTTKRHLYCTDNGPNLGFGAASTGEITEVPDPVAPDELILCEFGTYLGHPNRNRGRYDLRQNVYHGTDAADVSVPNVFTQGVAILPSSTDGIDEYRSAHFQEQLRGTLLVQKFLSFLRYTRVSPDGRSDLGAKLIRPFTGALGVHVLPDGAIAALDLANDRIQILRPNDQSAVGFVVHDIFPWRAPASGGYPFVISGVGFGTLADTSVSIGGIDATLVSVTSNRIRGLIPANLAPSLQLDDVQVTVGVALQVLGEAFRYLLPVGEALGFWDDLGITELPAALGEVSCAELDGVMYVFGEGDSATYAYDLQGRSWSSDLAVRPFVGNHMGVEVIDGLLYLIGGLSGGSEGKLQIYDPLMDSWSLGSDMSWSAGSVCTSVIEGKIYVAGGIVGTFTVNNFAVYDPALDNWTGLARMPDGGRNHTAAGTDGKRLYIFGGRKGGNFVTNGFDTLMIYDPLLDTWASSDEATSPLAPLPIGRGGMGKAIWYQNEFYVFGGETNSGPGATIDQVYDRVDVYDPLTNAWRLEAPMGSARHGIYPVLFESRIFVVGGGLAAGFAQSSTHDSFTRQ